MSPWDEKHVLRGSPLYMAPEMVCQRQYDARVDLWSVGVILYGESSVPCPTLRPALCVLGRASLVTPKGFNEKADLNGPEPLLWGLSALPGVGQARLHPVPPSLPSASLHRSPLRAAPLCLQVVHRAGREDPE